MQKGTINVQTENIFPIIKKFLYSDTEIFVRELVSNAVDASQKLLTLSSAGEVKEEVGDLKVHVILDKDAGTLTIRDNGIGMTADDVNKYINEVAFSGAEEFLEKYKNKDPKSIIGHFGLGFYSSFMVSDKVQIQTKSFKKGSQAVQWESNGNPEYEITDIDKKERGTDIVLFIAEDSKEYLEEARIGEVLSKYCKFLPIEVEFGTKKEWIDHPKGEKDEDGNVKKESIDVPNIINNTSPAWIKKPVDLKDEDYKSFYNELYPFTEDPLFQIHLNVDYPFNLTGILYFPRLKNQVEVQKNKIQLYSNQVFITDSVENIVPEFLTLLHGVIDSPDIPLNVSRSYLQSDSNVRKISNHITKKVADKLSSMFKKDREDFQNKWDDIQVFIQYGILSDEKFNEKAKDFLLLKNTDGKYFTVEEYKEKIKANQVDKNDRTVILYTHDVNEHDSLINSANDKGYDVLVLDGPLSSHFIQKAEQDFGVSFARVDADTLDNIIPKDEEIPSKLSKEEEEKLKPIFEDISEKEKFTIQVESLSESEKPVLITQSEFMRRMKEQQALGGGGMHMMGNLPEMYNLVVNANHSFISKILKAKKADKQKLAKQAFDLALLSQGMLKGKDLTDFVERSYELI
ncbi:MAG: molecular chaperone HtpG [Crocinitomicaceae bacterium]|nr:molecular chaperone HtpG [Crocinitomicaceae bacterium]|tara:strand:- start:2074 stop:3957 length:1884 start_codon:yes stop_codon:yes gene_type:complete